MSHNPIIEQRKLGRFEQVEIPMQRDGYLYQRGAFYRHLPSGDSLTFGERAKGGWSFYLVDKSTQQMNWRVRFNAKGQREQFNLTVRMRYRVANTREMVEENVTDTEALIVRQLEPHFRRTARTFALDEHQLAETEFESLITPSLFDQCGLQLIDSDVAIHISDNELTHIEDVRRLKRAMKVPQQVVHSTEIASHDPTHQFRTDVILDYRVTNPKALPTDTLEEAEEWLWRRVRAALRRVSRKYAVDQLVEVDDALLAKLEDDLFEGHGLEIVSAEIEIGLDETAYAHARELADIRRQRRIKEEHHLTAQLEQDHELSVRERYFKYYEPLIESEDWPLLAAALAENQMDTKEVFLRLDIRKQKKIETQMNLLGFMIEKDKVSELDEAKFARSILSDMTQSGDGQQTYKQLEQLEMDDDFYDNLPVDEDDEEEAVDEMEDDEDDYLEAESDGDDSFVVVGLDDEEERDEDEEADES